MKLQLVIALVPNWNTLSPGELQAALNARNQLYVDLKKYNLIEVARVIGTANMNNFIEAVQTAGHNWMIQQATSDFTPGDEFQNAELVKIPNVFAQQLAKHTRRVVSLLELHQLNPTLQEISQAQFDLNLKLEIQREDDEATDRLYRHRENLSRWDGNPLTKPEL